MIAPKPSVSTRPKQLIPENQKNATWAIDNMDWCISMSPFYRRTKEERFYNLFNGKRDQERFSTITATYGIEYPVGKMKHFPLIKPLLHRQAGELQERPWGTTIRASDNDAIELKTQEMGNAILNDIIEAIKSPDTASVDSVIDKLEKYYKEDFQTNFEIGAAHVLEDYRLRHDLEQKGWEFFTDKQITGREYYYCRVNRIGEAPETRVIRPGTIFYADNNAKWVQECDWAVHCVRMSPTEIIDRWGDKMTPEEIQRLENWLDVYTHDAFKVMSPAEVDRILYADADDSFQTNGNYYDKINVYFVEWKSERTENIYESPNKIDPEDPFIKHIASDKLFEIRGQRKNNIKRKYIQDLYQGVRIGDDMFVDMGRVKYPRRDALQPSRVHLSFNGLTFNGKIKPFSEVEVTEDLQDLYDIMHFHKENLIAMSGTKGSYMDLSQLPDFGTGDFKDNLKMWLYYKKMGAAFIDRAKDSADNSFNQFPVYNDSIDQSLSVVLEMIRHIEEVAGRIISINRQQLGDTSQYDGKDVTKMAIGNSSLANVPFFNEHDEFMRKLCEDIVNACKVTYREGYNGSYLNNQFVQTIFTLEPEFSAHDYRVYFTNRMSDQRAIEDIRAWAYKMLDSQMIQFEDILPLFRKSSLRDIEVTVKNSIDQRKKAVEEQNRQVQQLQQQLTIAKEQAEVGKLNAQITELQSKADRLTRESELEEKALALQQQFESKKLDNDSQRVALEGKQIDAATAQKKGPGGNAVEVRNK